MENPFRFWGPVTGARFCGREPQIARLERAARRRLPTAVVGPSGSGVSSLGAEFARRLREQGLRAARVELTPELGPRAAGEALAEALDGGGPSGRRPSGAATPGEDVAEGEVRCLLVDRAHRLGEDGFVELRGRLARAAERDGPLVPVYLGTRPPAVRRLVTRPTGASDGGGAGGGRVLRLGAIPPAAWLPYVLERFLETDRWIANEHVEEAVSLTRGRPRATQFLFRLLWSGVDAGGGVRDGDVDAALSRALARAAPAIDRRLEALTPNQRRTLAGIARAGTEVEPYASRFVERCELASPSSVQRALPALRRAGLVERSGGGAGGRAGRGPTEEGADGRAGGLRVAEPFTEALLRRRGDRR